MQLKFFSLWTLQDKSTRESFRDVKPEQEKEKTHTFYSQDVINCSAIYRGII